MVPSTCTEYAKKHQILQHIAGDGFQVQAVISVKIDRIKPILAPSYKVNKNVSERDMIQGAMQTYGVKPI